jgi:purine-nucleoside phosphorylase
MEAAALYANAAYLNKKALCILTISDSLVSEEVTTSDEREKTFTDMIKIALEIA